MPHPGDSLPAFLICVALAFDEDLERTLPRAFGHFGVRASEVRLGELEIEHRLAFGLVFGVADLASLLFGGLPRLVRFRVLESTQ